MADRSGFVSAYIAFCERQDEEAELDAAAAAAERQEMARRPGKDGR